MAGDAEVAGVACYCATVRRFTNRMIREREEGEGSSFPSFARPGGRPSGTLHGRRPWSSPANMARGLGSTRAPRN